MSLFAYNPGEDALLVEKGKSYPVGMWISVEVALPPLDYPVACLTAQDGLLVGRRILRGTSWKWGGAGWRNPLIGDGVTHWLVWSGLPDLAIPVSNIVPPQPSDMQTFIDPNSAWPTADRDKMLVKKGGTYPGNVWIRVDEALPPNSLESTFDNTLLLTQQGEVLSGTRAYTLGSWHWAPPYGGRTVQFVLSEPKGYGMIIYWYKLPEIPPEDDRKAIADRLYSEQWRRWKVIRNIKRGLVLVAFAALIIFYIVCRAKGIHAPFVQFFSFVAFILMFFAILSLSLLGLSVLIAGIAGIVAIYKDRRNDPSQKIDVSDVKWVAGGLAAIAVSATLFVLISFV